MDFFWLQTAFEVIDLRSFSNLWFWIALAVMWSTASHYVLGIPFDLVQRAGRGNSQALADVHTLAGVQSRRLIYIAEVSGLWITGFACFVLTALALAGFVYGLEFAQALFLLGLPMSLVWAMSVHTARRVTGADSARLLRLLSWHRKKVQLTGVFSIFCTSMWGMWTNMNINVLGT